MKKSITEHPEFKAQIDKLTSYLPDGRAKRLKIIDYKEAAKITQTILQAEYDKEMIEFDLWKKEKQVSIFVNGDNIDCHVGVNVHTGGFICNYKQLLGLFRKE